MNENIQNESETKDNPAQKTKRSFFNKRNIIIALILIIIGGGGYFSYRYQVFDYFIFDQPDRTLKGHIRRVSSVVFSPDGQTLASGSYDGSVKLWDAASGNLKLTIEVDEDEVRAVAFSPDGRMLATGGRNEAVALYDSSNGKLLYVKQYDSDVLSLAFSPDGQTLAVATSGIYLLDSTNGNMKKFIPTENFYALAVAFSPDGKTLAGSFSDETKLWDAANGNLKQTFVKGSDSWHPLIFSPDGQTLVGGSLTGKIFVLEITTGNLKHTIKANSDKVPIAFSPDGKTLASGGYDVSKEKERYEGEIEFWDIATGTLSRKFAIQRSTVASLTFSPDGKTLAAGNYNGTIGLWKLE